VNRLLAGCLIALPLLGACALVPSTCDVVIWGASQAPAVGSNVPAGVQPLAAADDIDWAASRLGAAEAGPLILTLVLRPDAAARVADFTRAHLGGILPIGLDGRIVLVPQYLHPLDEGTIKIAEDPTEAAALERFRACVGG
jgi:hypothetical protein